MKNQLSFKSSDELFDAGYAVMSYSIADNTSHWRFKGESFETPRIIGTKYATVNGSQISVYPISQLEKLLQEAKQP